MLCNCHMGIFIATLWFVFAIIHVFIHNYGGRSADVIYFSHGDIQHFFPLLTKK